MQFYNYLFADSGHLERQNKYRKKTQKHISRIQFKKRAKPKPKEKQLYSQIPFRSQAKPKSKGKDYKQL